MAIPVRTRSQTPPFLTTNTIRAFVARIEKLSPLFLRRLQTRVSDSVFLVFPATQVFRAVAAFRLFLQEATQSRFARNVWLLAGGTALARAVTAGASPVLARIYSPADFGVFAVFFSMVTAAVVTASFNYDQAVLVPKDDEVAAGLVIWAFCVLLTNTALIALAVGFFATQIIHAVGAPGLRGYLWLLPISVFGGGAFYILNAWAIRTASFRSLSKRRIWQSVWQVLLQLTIPAITPGPLGLLLGDSVGRGAGSITLAREMAGYVKRHNLRLNFGMIRKAAGAYSRYPTYGLGALLLHISLSVMPPVLIMAHFGAVVTGAYSFTSLVVGIASNVIGSSIGQVYFNKAAVLARTEPAELLSLFGRTSALCAVIAAGPFACLALFGPTLFATVFGANWVQAGAFARLLAVPYFVIFVASPVFPVLALLQRQPWQLVIDGAGAALMIGLILTVARLHLGAQYAIAAYGISMTFTYLGLYIAAGLAILSRIRSQVESGSLTIQEEPQCR